MTISSASYRRVGLIKEKRKSIAVINCYYNYIITISWQVPTGNIGHPKKKFKVVPWTKRLNEMTHRSLYTSYVCLNLTQRDLLWVTKYTLYGLH